MDQMRQNPFAGDIVRLKDYPIAYRRRVGNWRILFDVDGDTCIVTVQAVVRRTSRTYS
jgi:mRNA-degrading endonuclease RelE of RelBE toxin-antitoxin system